jgi:hypothetical protein
VTPDPEQATPLHEAGAARSGSEGDIMMMKAIDEICDAFEGLVALVGDHVETHYGRSRHQQNPFAEALKVPAYYTAESKSLHVNGHGKELSNHQKLRRQAERDAIENAIVAFAKILRGLPLLDHKDVSFKIEFAKRAKPTQNQAVRFEIDGAPVCTSFLVVGSAVKRLRDYLTMISNAVISEPLVLWSVDKHLTYAESSEMALFKILCANAVAQGHSELPTSPGNPMQVACLEHWPKTYSRLAALSAGTAY